ncbi:hypothetical protein N234_37505 [Ralstonia pickettii DTP0602]|nr:hypothetical protein N234_37505 [Ralstonia pickettii DTP0602]
MVLPAVAGVGAVVDVDVADPGLPVVSDPGLPVVVAADVALAGAESPPPPPQPATVTIRQASGTAASLMWMRFIESPLSRLF